MQKTRSSKAAKGIAAVRPAAINDLLSEMYRETGKERHPVTYEERDGIRYFKDARGRSAGVMSAALHEKIKAIGGNKK